MSSPHQVYEFPVSSSDIAVHRTRVARALGYRELPEVVANLIDDLLPRVNRRLRIRCGVALLPGEILRVCEDTIECAGTTFSTGALIAGRLGKCRTLALFAATIGPEVEKWSRELMAGPDMLSGFVVDIIGSESVEHVVDLLEDKLASQVRWRHWTLTNRYSPGYCGWPVTEQHKLFALLPPDFCGITLTPHALMVPLKSVSGIIGLGPDVLREEYDCSLCDMIDCLRREGGRDRST
jgi:hypothetical protein